MTTSRPQKSTSFLRAVVLAAAIFLVVLAVVELAVGTFFIGLVARRIEDRRRVEFLESWDRFLAQRKRIHESKVTGYGWWNELARAIDTRNIRYILDEALGGDASLVREYDVFLAAGRNNELFFAAIDGKTLTAEPAFVKGALDGKLEQEFYERTLSKVTEMRPAYLANVVNATHKRSLDAPIVWHHITRYNGQVRLLTLTPVSTNEGYPYTPGYLLFGYSLDKIVALAQDVIPARITVHTSKPAESYATLPVAGLRPAEQYFVSFEPRYLVADSARNTMYILILAQIIVGVGVFVLIAPRFARRYARELEDTVDERTTQLTEANRELEHRQEQIARELKMARIVQQNLLPDAEYQRGRLRVSCLYRPVHDLGGDLYDVSDMADGRLGVLVADVSGHGVPAALVSMMVKLSFVNNATSELSPNETLRLMNLDLNPLLAEGDYLTAAYAVVRADTGEVCYALGGHRSPIHYRAETGQAVELEEARGPLLGPFPRANFASCVVFLKPGDRLFLYSDGLVEEKDPDLHMYGVGRLIQRIEQTGHLAISEVRERLLEDLALFKGDTAVADDITLVIVELTNAEPGEALRAVAGASLPFQN